MAVDQYGRTIFESGYDYDDALRRRLNRIRQQDRERSAYEANRSALIAQQRAFDEEMELRRAGVESLGIASRNAESMRRYGADLLGRINSVGNPWAQQGSSGFEQFVNQIAAKESSNNYSARNRHSGALGKYQIMPSNIPSWSREALGYSVTPSQFLASPQIQEQVARYKLRQYYQAYGPAGAAIAWYAGPAAAQRYMRTGQISRAAQGAYPSIYQYVQSILGGLR